MARAVELLKNDQLPIKTIASNCGYTEVSNFYRDFKSVYGVSPKQMRHMHMITHLHSMRSQTDLEPQVSQ